MTEEIAGVDNAGAGVNNSGGYFIGGHCKSGQGQRKSHGWTMKEDISLVDIALFVQYDDLTNIDYDKDMDC